MRAERPAPVVDTLCIIGAGLIGSSLLRGARGHGLARHLVAADVSADVIGRVKALGLADETTVDLESAVKQADLVIGCVPPGSYGILAQAIGPHLKNGAILSDVGSVKASIVAQVTPFLRKDVHFIPAHPVAGTEKSGPDAGFAELFKDRWCILTPPDTVDAKALATLTAFWRGLGSRIEIMTPDHHDLVLAITSHVPHLIAYNIVGTASDLEAVTESEVIKFSAGGFRDFTRIAASDPTMWRDVFLHNKAAVLEVLGRFTEDLIALQRNIRWAEGDQLFELFTRTRAIRRSIIDQKQDTAAADFGRQGEGDRR